MTSLGRGSDEATDRAVPVLAETPAVTGLPGAATRASADGTTASQPRPSGQNKPGDRAVERGSRTTEASRLRPAWRNDSLPPSPHYRPQ